MTELIIINGEVKNCEVLFECNSVDDLASFKMIREGVEVTPDNAPTFDIFDIKLIAEPRSPYGFSSLFKRNENIDEWEYMGFGHSGACSVVTALLKQLQRKTAEYEELKNNNDLADVVLQRKLDKLINRNNRLEEELNQIKLLLDGKNEQYNQKTQECEALKKRVELARKENNRLTSEVCDTRNYAGSLQNKLQIATEALKLLATKNMVNIDEIAQQALEQIESEE